MNRTAAIPLIGIALLSGACANNSRHIGLQNGTSLSAERHGMWTRPSEVGFKMGGEIGASATASRVLGFNVGESKPATSVAAVLGPLTGARKLDNNAGFAAYKAVQDNGAEGIYVTRIERESSGFLFFYRKQTVTVYGRALTLADYGPITEKRADQWRFRNTGPDLVVVKEGDAQVQLPIEVK